MRIISTLNLAHLLRAAGVYSEEKFLVTFEPTAAPAPRILHSTVILRGLNALSRKLNVSSAELFVSSNHTDNAGVVHIYVDRIVGGLIVGNQHSSVHLKNGQVIAMAGSIASTELTSITDSGSLLDTFRIRIMEETAIKIASDFYHSQSTGRANLILLNTEQGLEKFYEVGLSDADGDQRMSVLVNASSGEIISGNGLVKSYTYNAIPLPKDRPTSGFANIVNPENYTASPKGWSIKGSTYGNNARVILEAGAYHLQSNQSIFKGNWDRNNDPIAKANADAALANAFYAVNMMHDITYPYGFNEVAGNFQFNNFNKGGFENDNILVVIQDSTVPNNAMFTAAEDGVRGKLNLGIFQITNPNRDAALENSIIIHEYAHGVVGRLTGGRMRATCMYGPIPDALDEGWADTFAFMLTTKPPTSNSRVYGIGSYIADRENGVRMFPYSTNLTINPLKFSDFRDDPDVEESVHVGGTVWGSILFEVYSLLVSVKGFSSSWMNPNQLKGNIVMMQLIISGLQYQPCNPGFIQARDAIIFADKVHYNGLHRCLLWRGYSKRGLGVNAKAITTIEGGNYHIDGFDIPTDCI